eukprot:5506328-Pyramimonas_sp.AAC.1
MGASRPPGASWRSDRPPGTTPVTEVGNCWGLHWGLVLSRIAWSGVLHFTRSCIVLYCAP